MGKGSALNSWLREFVTLVFTQTIQAFIYAIIITIILYAMTSASGLTNDDNNAAVGMMATFSMFSIFKVESFAKKIFGIHDTPASHTNAMKSIAKTAFAVSLGKRVLNNVGKVTGGIRSITKTRAENKKIKNRLDEDMQDLGYQQDASGNWVKTSSLSGTGGSGGSGGTVGTVGSSSSSGSGNSDARRMRAALRNAEDQVAAIKKQREEGIKSIASGVTETIGATIGAGTGAILGGSDSDLDGLINGIIAGAGVGDVVGKSAVDSVDRLNQFIKRRYKGQSGISSRELNDAINKVKTTVDDIE